MCFFKNNRIVTLEDKNPVVEQTMSVSKEKESEAAVPHSIYSTAEEKISVIGKNGGEHLISREGAAKANLPPLWKLAEEFNEEAIAEHTLASRLRP